MYKVVIIDDEPMIAEGLTKGIEWAKWNCVVAGTAGNGTEGIELVKKVCPDIMITDICMPGMDGLLMIAALKSEYPDMQISILTGYREFDYAKRALELGVTRFLLKPSKWAELEEAITVMTEKLPEKEERERTSEPASETEKEPDAAGNFIVHNALDYMRQHYAEKITLVDVADAVYVSQWHLSKLLNRVTGKNFSEHLNEIRMEQAKEMLKDQSLRISDIALQLGYADLAHFSRVFKKITGVSAGEYRNSL